MEKEIRTNGKIYHTVSYNSGFKANSFDLSQDKIKVSGLGDSQLVFVHLFVGADDDNGQIVVLGGGTREVTYIFDDIIHQVFGVLGCGGFYHFI